MAVEITYTSVACNWSRYSTDWGNNNLICYGACNSISIYDPEKDDYGAITNTLCHHKNAVNSVRWIKSQNEAQETEIVSTSCDATACIWRENKEGSFDLVQSLEGHSKDVIIGDGMKLINSNGQDSIIIATASTDSTVKIWSEDEKEVLSCVQTLDLLNEICFEIRIKYLPETNIPLMICANTDCKIYLYAKSGELFIKVNVLQGHEDFVRTIDTIFIDSKTMFIASGDQAGQIRIWQLSSQNPSSQEMNSMSDGYKPEAQNFSVNKDEKQYDFTINIESVILAHDGMINGIQWHPKLKTESGSHQPLKILSCSMDKTMILWEPDVQSGVWLESVRVGEVGGNSLGFFGCKFGPLGKNILAYSKQGSFHHWSLNQDTGSWDPKLSASGHFQGVTDIAWEPEGEFLLSVSSDQTTRIHAPWRRNDGKVTWHEIARPQIHGHDMSCIAALSRYEFASGAEEKVGRVFNAPKNFMDNFHRICNIKDDSEKVSAIPQGASVPSLGLSNKAVFEGHEETKDKKSNDYPEPYFTQVDLHEPPTEEHLMQNTLWPEVQKLYGHGYDIFCMAAAHDGSLLASACKSTSLQHAAIIIWDAKTWKLAQKLQSHSLTVTQMAFSPDDRFLVSVSRDRTWSIFERIRKDDVDSNEHYKLSAKSPKNSSSHSRIIWSCSWSPDSKYFVTSSREGKVIVWGMSENHNWTDPKMWTLKLPDSVTATAFASVPSNGTIPEKYVIILGTEGGLIYIYEWQPKCENDAEKSWKHLSTLTNNIAHHKAVKRLVFRPNKRKSGQNGNHLEFASCGEDHIVKVYNMKL